MNNVGKYNGSGADENKFCKKPTVEAVALKVTQEAAPGNGSISLFDAARRDDRVRTAHDKHVSCPKIADFNM